MALIPTKPSVPQQRINIELDGSIYIIDLTWMGRMGYWVLDLYDEDLNPLVRNKILSNEANVLLNSYANPDVPFATLAVFSPNPNTSLNFNNLGKDVQLYFV